MGISTRTGCTTDGTRRSRSRVTCEARCVRALDAMGKKCLRRPGAGGGDGGRRCARDAAIARWSSEARAFERARGRRGGAQDVEWGRRGAFGMVKARSGEIARVVRVMRRANACTDESTLVCFPRIGRIRLRHRLALAKEEGGHQPSVSVPECALHSMVSGGCGDDDRRDQTGDELDIDFANQSQVSYI